MTRKSSSKLVSLLLLCGLSGFGCQSWTDFRVARFFEERAPSGKPDELASIWMSGITYQPDPREPGKQIPGFSGRFLLIENHNGNQGFSVTAEGNLVMELYDDGPSVAPDPRAPRERWTIPSSELQKMLRRDISGWGYTIWIPWSQRSDVQNIKLLSRFELKDGKTLYGQECNMKIRDNRGLVTPEVNLNYGQLIPKKP